MNTKNRREREEVVKMMAEALAEGGLTSYEAADMLMASLEKSCQVVYGRNIDFKNKRSCYLSGINAYLKNKTTFEQFFEYIETLSSVLREEGG